MSPAVSASPRPASHSLSTRRTPAFTLVELLVVITIIATLTAVAFGVFVKGTARAKNARAVENMRQVGLAIASYMGDNDRLPGFGSVAVSPLIVEGEVTQGTVLAPYLGGATPSATPQYAEVFRPPNLKSNNMGGKKNWYEVTCYGMYSAGRFASGKAYLPSTNAAGEDIGGPFGKEGDPAPVGWKPAQLDSQLSQYSQINSGKIATISMVPAMLEVNATAGSWPGVVPPKPVAGDRVHVLYFDWRVESVAPQFFYTE